MWATNSLIGSSLSFWLKAGILPFLVLVSGFLFEIETDVGAERAMITYRVAAEANTGDESEWSHD